jgi:MFS family permease
MLASGGDFRLVFRIAVLPAFVSVALLALFVPEPARSSRPRAERPRLQWCEISAFPPAFWSVIAVGASFTLARFSEAFLILRASDLGLANDYLPLALVVMNFVYGASAYPAGRLSDHLDRRRVLAAGAGVLMLADLVLARAAGVAGLVLGVALWGLHLGFSQGLLAALVADAAPPQRRGTAFGLFNLVSGIVLLAASVLAGQLWDRAGAPLVFYAGAGFAGLTCLGLLLRTQSHDGQGSTPIE